MNYTTKLKVQTSIYIVKTPAQVIGNTKSQYTVHHYSCYTILCCYKKKEPVEFAFYTICLRINESVIFRNLFCKHSNLQISLSNISTR